MTSSQKTVTFFPWLNLSEQASVGKVQIIPFRDQEGHVQSAFKDLEAVMTGILSSYVDIEHQPIPTCCIAVIDGCSPQWNLQDDDRQQVQRAAAILSLSSCARNEYFEHIGSYTNSTHFQSYTQSYIEPVDYVTLRVRRRDGETLIGGYRHGEVRFQGPPQYRRQGVVQIDKRFLDAVNSALANNSKTMRRLTAALSFFNLANTDSDLMSLEAEGILIGAAFEQLLHKNAANQLSAEFGELFKEFGRVSFEQAVQTRTGIVIKSDPAKQKFAHRKWTKELYELRSSYAHANDQSARQWIWSPYEHLVMSAFVFPLLVKLCLRREGHYVLNYEDEVRCLAVDRLLAIPNWQSRVGVNMNAWQKAIADAKREVRVQKGIERLKKLGLVHNPEVH